MQIRKKEVSRYLTFFLFAHLIIWVLVPAVSNINLPLDTIEALAWGSNLDWGYNKHPPLSAWMVELFYQIFGNQDWAYYLLSQLCVLSAFFIIFKFSEDFFKNKILSLISVLLLEGIYFYNFTTPEFNVNVCQLPFWALTVYYFWKSVNEKNNINWLLFGFFAGLGILSKYLFIYLLIGIDIFLIYLIIKKKFNFKSLISLISFFAVLIPHFIWLVNNDFKTISYALHRTGINEHVYLNHIFHPMFFLIKQIGILIPVFIMIFLLAPKLKFKINPKDRKLVFLLIINIVPILLMLLTSLFTGAKIRTMWMTPFYLFSGVMLVYILEKKIILNKIKYFLISFMILFILSPSIYLYISISEPNKRTDYQGRKIAKEVQNKYENNFKGKIIWVVGDEWHGGNLSYHLKSRPKWFYVGGTKDFQKNDNLNSPYGIVSTIGISNIEVSKEFKKVCEQTKGIFFLAEKIGFCVSGSNKK